MHNSATWWSACYSSRHHTQNSLEPMITLTAEVDDLLNQGMADDYNCEPEHSAMGEEAAAGTDILLPQKAEVSATPLDTSSQASVEEMETSLGEKPHQHLSSHGHM